MRRAFSVLAPFSVLASAIFACESDPNPGSGPTPQLDGSTPSFDGGQQAFDSGTPDSDAPSAAPSVTVTVVGRSGPKANVRVVFHDAAGAVLESKVTDASGKAKSTGALPAMASALIAQDGERHVVTWTAIEDGDDLILREPDRGGDEKLGQFDVTLPSAYEDNARYNIYASGCWGTGADTSATIELYPWCVSGNTSAVLVRALGPDNQTVAGSFKKGNQVPTDGSNVAVTTGAWADATPVTITATNTPPDRGVDAELFEIADGHSFSDGFGYRGLENGSATFNTIAGFADALQTAIYLTPPSGGAQIIAQRAAPSPTFTFDASKVLPPIDSASLADEAEIRRPVISWASSSTAGTDGGLVRLMTWGADETTFTWTFVVPPGSTNVSAPTLPTDADEFLPNPDAGAMGWFPPEVVFVEADVLPSYKEFRAQQGAIVPAGMSIAYRLPTLPVNGTYRTTSFAFAL